MKIVGKRPVMKYYIALLNDKNSFEFTVCVHYDEMIERFIFFPFFFFFVGRCLGVSDALGEKRTDHTAVMTALLCSYLRHHSGRQNSVGRIC